MIALLCLWALQGASVATAPFELLPKANPAIETQALQAHIAMLASDELKGRAAFTPESARVSLYLVAALKQAKVPSVQALGGYLQPAPFERTRQVGPIELSLVDGKGERHALVYGKEFRLGRERSLNQPRTLAVQVTDAENTATLVPSLEQAIVFLGTSKQWRAWRDEHGKEAWGLILYHERGSEERGELPLPDPQVVPAWYPKDAKDAEETPVVRLYGPLDDWIAQATELIYAPNRVVEAITEPNVVGWIQGVGTEAEPELAQEVIVLSAHYDHIGIDPRAEPGTDNIRNGADDDASGVAVLLELAEAYAAGPAPARSVLFLFACAEEQGVWGTEYFVQAPTVPLERIVCNLNLEMLGRPDDLVGGSGQLWLTGFERSSLGPAFQAAGIAVVADPRLEMSFFTRSDNIVFVKEGVVAQTLSSYNMHKDYHHVGDEIKLIDFEHLTASARAALQAAQELTSGRVRPTWNEGEPKGFLKK